MTSSWDFADESPEIFGVLRPGIEPGTSSAAGEHLNHYATQLHLDYVQQICQYNKWHKDPIQTSPIAVQLGGLMVKLLACCAGGPGFNP